MAAFSSIHPKISSTSSSVIHPEREVAISNKLAIITFILVMLLYGSPVLMNDVATQERIMVQGTGFEPAKHYALGPKPSPFDHSGTPA